MSSATMTTFLFPRIVQSGLGARKLIGPLLQQLGVGKCILVTDPGLDRAGHAMDVVTLAKALNISVDIWPYVEPEPSTNSIKDAFGFMTQLQEQKGPLDAVIGLGGGSSIDTAKAISVLQPGQRIQDLKVPAQPPPGLPIIAVPTTAGSGSEATKACVITCSDSHEKMLCMSPGLQPYAVVLDAEYTLSCPPALVAHTGLDALTHCVEAFVSRKQNFFSDTIALQGMTIITRNLLTVYNDSNGQNAAARAEMLQGSFLGGMAFSNSSVALVHGMARPLGSFFGIPHGLSNAMLLPRVTEFSALGRAASRYADVARAIGVADDRDHDGVAVTELVHYLRGLNRQLNVPSPKEFGVSVEDYSKNIPIMVEQAIASGSPMNNPVIPSPQEMIELYKDIYEEA